MNILFYLSCTPNPKNGGIERVSHILAKEFIKRGHKCYCAYYYTVESDYVSDVYTRSYFIPSDDPDTLQKLREIVKDNKINVILNQLAYIKNICECFNVIKTERPEIKLITTYHNNPFRNKYFINWGDCRGVKSLIKKTIRKFYPNLLISRYNFSYRKRLSKDLKYVDYYTFLSTKYVEKIQTKLKLESPKILAIPNPPTYHSHFNIENYGVKEKTVLFIGRYKESQKRVSEILKIWKLLESTGYNGWKLILGGHGPDEKIYRQYIIDNKLQSIEFLGKVDPLRYYERASIFLMTSTYEGWAMTLFESMQMGCVPIVYNTFYAAEELVNNNHNGFLITDQDKMAFKNKLSNLMNDDRLRKQMASNAIEFTKKYQLSDIIDSWESLMH